MYFLYFKKGSRMTQDYSTDYEGHLCALLCIQISGWGQHVDGRWQINKLENTGRTGLVKGGHLLQITLSCLWDSSNVCSSTLEIETRKVTADQRLRKNQTDCHCLAESKERCHESKKKPKATTFVRRGGLRSNGQRKMRRIRRKCQGEVLWRREDLEPVYRWKG